MSGTWTPLISAAAVITMVGLSPLGSALTDVAAPTLAPVQAPQSSGSEAFKPTARLPPDANGILAPAPAIDSRLVVPGPALTASQTRVARHVTAADPTLKLLLLHSGYTITDDVPWTDTGSDVVIGDDLTLSLNQPLSGTFTLPTLHYDPTGGTATPIRLHEAISGATVLKVGVDLRTRSVVNIQPDDNASVSDAGGNTTFPTTDPTGK